MITIGRGAGQPLEQQLQLAVLSCIATPRKFCTVTSQHGKAARIVNRTGPQHSGNHSLRRSNKPFGLPSLQVPPLAKIEDELQHRFRSTGRCATRCWRWRGLHAFLSAAMPIRACPEQSQALCALQYHPTPGLTSLRASCRP